VYQSETAAQWFSHFFEKPFVNRVNRRVPILTLILERSTKCRWVRDQLADYRGLRSDFARQIYFPLIQ
jgi:hypothetical protein